MCIKTVTNISAYYVWLFIRSPDYKNRLGQDKDDFSSNYRIILPEMSVDWIDDSCWLLAKRNIQESNW